MSNIINTEIIKNYMEENNLSKRAFCKLCKISPATLERILMNKDSVRLMVIFRIARALKTPVYKLFN